MIKKMICYFAVLLSVSLCFFFCAGAVEISAQSAVVLDARTNEIVYQKDAFEKRSMASTTKIMTAFLAIESGRLCDTVNITSEMTRAEGTSLGLHAGDKITLCDLVYGMMLESGNDAANAAALHLCGSFSSFAALMNERARQIGMKSTNFVTPSGLDDEEHYSTAYDMALLASYCVKNSVFRSVCSAKKYTARLLEPQTKLYFSNKLCFGTGSPVFFELPLIKNLTKTFMCEKTSIV
ncbi:MAG: D-alanyl-D-alanine carboxypeptidase, partial [Clostridia bacterium]|nr:D-alanyl-D-alanine carboxypeptidase [Clostridia bacterium]